MAKIRIKTKGGHTHQVGHTLFTEKTRTFTYGDETETAIYYKAWRLRSDGDVQVRIIRTIDPETRDVKTEHRGSDFRSVGKIKHGPNITEEFLADWLEKKGHTIVKRQFRI